jgi:predicted transcriptional regulator
VEKSYLMKYRNRTDIMAQMLESALRVPISKTRMMYTAYVPHEQMSEFLNLLVVNDLIRRDGQSGLYSASPKGTRFVEYYQGLLECFRMPIAPESLEQIHTKHSIDDSLSV